MKNYKIWGSLVLLIIVFIILIRTKVIDFSGRATTTPEYMIANLGCTDCHGTKLEGTDKGPALHNLNTNWTKVNLVKYLQKPTQFMNFPRFVKYEGQYRKYLMPAYDTVNVKTLEMVADYILNK
jgi:Cytochrome c